MATDSRERCASRWRCNCRILVVLVCVMSLLPGCESVRFYEKRLLTAPLMTLGESPDRVHLFANCTYTKEGSIGGIRTSAGGGCGCY